LGAEVFTTPAFGVRLSFVELISVYSTQGGKMRKFSFVLLVMLIGSAAHAQNFLAQPEINIEGTPPVPVPPPTHPPVPVPTIPHFSYWKPMWDKSAAVTNDFLKGDWITIGRATTNNCNQFKDQSSLDGIKNSDGSDFVSLTFADVPSNPQPVFSAQVNGMGSSTASQGPYEVAAQEPQLSTWASGSTQTHDAWYEFSCRDSQDGNMICALGLRTSLNDPSHWDEQSRRCLTDDYGIILVYKHK
jgi:hypothetical protein